MTLSSPPGASRPKTVFEILIEFDNFAPYLALGDNRRRPKKLTRQAPGAHPAESTLSHTSCPLPLKFLSPAICFPHHLPSPKSSSLLVLAHRSPLFKTLSFYLNCTLYSFFKSVATNNEFMSIENLKTFGKSPQYLVSFFLFRPSPEKPAKAACHNSHVPEPSGFYRAFYCLRLQRLCLEVMGLWWRRSEIAGYP